MHLANRPLPRWLGPVLLAIVVADVAVGVIAHRTLSPLLLTLAIGVPTAIALDSVGLADKRHLQALVRPATVFTVAFDRATAARLGDLGEGSFADERALLVADPAGLEFWDESANPKRVLVIAWGRLAGATVESHDTRSLHMIALRVPGVDPFILDVVRTRYERIRHRASTAAEVAAEVEARTIRDSDALREPQMIQPTPPILIEGDGEFEVFPTVALACQAFEAVDVIEGLYEGFDSEGRRLLLVAHGDRVLIELRPDSQPTPAALERRLREHIRQVGPALMGIADIDETPLEVMLHELIRFERGDYRDGRRRRG